MLVLEGLDLELAREEIFTLGAWIRASKERLVDNSVRRNEGLRDGSRHNDWVLETMITLVCHLCSFAHACEGRSLQAGTPELAYTTYTRSCGIEKTYGVGRDRLIPRVGMLELPPTLRWHKLDYNM
uniref:Uncharacterized protein n=1 Tax=Ananas comosus var. bracteatus TaxID=296719 RepID=A0A6V7NET6_ANACO|nr:unnamed protein product [Ananas comosus var. bracteatus]